VASALCRRCLKRHATLFISRGNKGQMELDANRKQDAESDRDVRHLANRISAAGCSWNPVRDRFCDNEVNKNSLSIIINADSGGAAALRVYI